MIDCTGWSFREQMDWFRRQFAQHAGLPFSEVLPVTNICFLLSPLMKSGTGLTD